MADFASRKPFDLGDAVRVTPAGSSSKRKRDPSDLSKFAPSRNGVYGFQQLSTNNPFKGAPPQEPHGGVLYFENDLDFKDFETFVRVLGLPMEQRHRGCRRFAAYVSESSDPLKDGYITQMRIVSDFALQYLFETISDKECREFVEQPVSMVGALWAFMEHERKRWGTSFTQDGECGLRGIFGGDGNFGREQLSFGIMVENSYHNVYRIWSRAWLVTK